LVSAEPVIAKKVETTMPHDLDALEPPLVSYGCTARVLRHFSISVLRLTLDVMGGMDLRDQLGGGFFRYTVDPDWQIPHFEKMLYTQALLGTLYLRASEVLNVPAYREVARDTLAFLLEGMKGEDGAYIASLSAADAEGVEGGY
jgi:uncharacterized protein YyaL (SSP411 family)